MGVFQNIFAAVSIWLFVEYTSKRFELGFMGKAVVTLLCLAPHMLTSYFSALHLFITNSVMSEALCMPLFLLFFMDCRHMTLPPKADIEHGCKSYAGATPPPVVQYPYQRTGGSLCTDLSVFFCML